jgi:hypothetical protein
MTLYKSCNTLPIYNFFKIFESDDFRYLIKGWDEDDDEVELVGVKLEETRALFNNIVFEYTDLTHNTKAKSTLKKQILIAEWQIVYDIVVGCVDLYLGSDDEQYLELIKEVGYPVDLTKELEPQLTAISRKMKGLKNKIQIYKIDLAKNFEQNKNEVKTDLDKEALYLEMNLDLKREINTRTTTVAKWVKIIELNKQKNSKKNEHV